MARGTMVAVLMSRSLKIQTLSGGARQPWNTNAVFHHIELKGKG
jgi:hypothetical protein